MRNLKTFILVISKCSSTIYSFVIPGAYVYLKEFFKGQKIIIKVLNKIRKIREWFLNHCDTMDCNVINIFSPFCLPFFVHFTNKSLRPEQSPEAKAALSSPAFFQPLKFLMPRRDARAYWPPEAVKCKKLS